MSEEHKGSKGKEFKDSSGWGWVLINLMAVAWITLPASIGLTRVFFS